MHQHFQKSKCVNMWDGAPKMLPMCPFSDCIRLLASMTLILTVPCRGFWCRLLIKEPDPPRGVGGTPPPAGRGIPG